MQVRVRAAVSGGQDILVPVVAPAAGPEARSFGSGPSDKGRASTSPASPPESVYPLRDLTSPGSVRCSDSVLGPLFQCLPSFRSQRSPRRRGSRRRCRFRARHGRHARGSGAGRLAHVAPHAERLGLQHGNARLDAASARAIAIGSCRFHTVNNILATGQDRLPLEPPAETAPTPTHANILPGFEVAAKADVVHVTSNILARPDDDACAFDADILPGRGRERPAPERVQRGRPPAGGGDRRSDPRRVGARPSCPGPRRLRGRHAHPGRCRRRRGSARRRSTSTS